jgi:hypothetical protein
MDRKESWLVTGFEPSSLLLLRKVSSLPHIVPDMHSVTLIPDKQLGPHCSKGD